MLITLIILVLAAIFFMNGKIRSDLVALCALILLLVFQILTPEEALSGFSNPIVIMMIGLFVVGGAIFQTGLAKMISNKMLKLAGKSELRLFILLMAVTSAIGAFVSNTGTVALLLPIAVSLAASFHMNPSRLLMPIAFASSMGGMMTLIGTPPNLVIQNTLTAHRNYPDKKVTKADAVVAEMGTLEGSNHRNINKMLVNQVLPTCQLQMGMTELAPGSVWNTMPAHVHSRRMEAYFYFEVPEEHAVCHFMGEVDETRHVWMKGDQAVLSPEWSIHSAAATHSYTFIWGMGGENLDYGDQDFSLITDLK